MKTSIVSAAFVSSVIALFAQQAGAGPAPIPAPVPAPVAEVDTLTTGGGGLALIGKRFDVAHEEKFVVTRRHHAKNAKRACKPRSSSSGSSGSSSSGSSSSGSSSGSSSTNNKKVNNAAVVPANNSSSSGSSSSTSSSGSSNSGSSSSSSSTSSNGGTSTASGSAAAFTGTNTGAILSWFKTNLGSDSTNGRSWCQTQYKDDWMCFAPSVGTMLKAFGNDYNKAGTAFCGLEAIVTNPATGKSITAFICDGFDDKWVKTPASLDLTVGAFTALYGSFDNNKNTVMTGATWKLTGNVVAKGTFKSSLSQ